MIYVHTAEASLHGGFQLHILRFLSQYVKPSRKDCENGAPMQEPDDILFQNIMFGKMFEQDLPDVQCARIYIHWVETQFYDLAACLDRANENLYQIYPHGKRDMK